MMNLHVQILLIIYSLLYGIVFSACLEMNYKYIYKQKRIPKYILSFLFIVNFVFLYFIVLRRINNGILHFYSFIFVGIGFVLAQVLINYLDKKHKK